MKIFYLYYQDDKSYVSYITVSINSKLSLLTEWRSPADYIGSTGWKENCKVKLVRLGFIWSVYKTVFFTGK